MSIGACPPAKLVATLDDCVRSCCSLLNAVVDRLLDSCIAWALS